MKTKQTDTRAMLLALGVPPFLATMTIPYMMFLPGTTDPDSPSVIEIIKGLQRGLRKLSYAAVQVNGVLDRETAMAIDEISPPVGSWMEKTWIQLYGDVLDAMRDPERKAHKIAYSMSGLGSYAYGPFPGSAIGTPSGGLGIFGIGEEKLEFGFGKKDPASCVGIGATKEVFAALQQAMNRINFVQGLPLIGVDGIIGKDTLVSGLRIAQAVFGPAEVFVWQNTTCAVVAKNAKAATKAFNAKADTMKAPKVVASPSGKKDTTETLINPKTVPSAALVPSGIWDAVKKYVPFLLVAGGVAYYVAQKRKAKKGSE